MQAAMHLTLHVLCFDPTEIGEIIRAAGPGVRFKDLEAPMEGEEDDREEGALLRCV